MTMTMTTLTEDVSNNGPSSGTVGMSDGGHDDRKKTSEIWLIDEHYWLKEISKDTVKRQCVEMDAKSTK